MRLIPSRFRLVFLSIAAAGFVQADPGVPFITYENQPQGTREKPLILRTYFPDPGLGPEVLEHHDTGYRARKYKPGKGDVSGFDDPIRGIPAAIGVHFGPDLSICWDTTECRLLYAWQGGFLDMTRYWGDPAAGTRKRFGYVPELVGPVIYLASGSNPFVVLDDFATADAPKYLRYELVNGVPEFVYELGKCTVHVRPEPGEKPLEILLHYKVKGSQEGADFYLAKYDFKIDRQSPQEFTVTITGVPGGEMKAEDDEIKFTTDEPNSKWGEALYTNFGCFACHTTDGTRGHGPTFAGLFGGERPIQGQDPVTADEAYIKESIVNPMARVVEGFPPGYMPPYPLADDQIQSIVLFIQGLASE